MPRRMVRGGLKLLATFVLVLAVAWGAAALWFDGPAAPWLSAGLVLASVALLVRVRPYGRALLGVLLLFVAVLSWRNNFV